MSAEVVLEVRNITKTFPGVVANDNVSLTLHRGEVLALLGENGAGKSTLMNIIYGLYHPDSGEIIVKGKKVQLGSPREAIEHGIGMVHQHFMLVPVMSVVENVMLGIESTSGPFLNKREAAERIRQISEQYGLKVDPYAIVEDLPVGVRQRVEIIKTLYREADILILDEPTAVLTPQEVEELFEIIEALTAQGKSVIFISHKLKEVLTIADRITVLRRGKVVGTVRPEETNEQQLAEMMVGRSVLLRVEKPPRDAGMPVLEVEDLWVRDDTGHMAVRGVSFTLYAGEILGIAGVQGNGQTELVKALSGLKHVEKGHIRIAGQPVTNLSPRTFYELGLGHVPEDRQHDGLILSLPIKDNIILNTYYKPPYSENMVLKHDVIAETAERLVKEFDVRTPGIYTRAGALSGGNQQKVIIAREFSRPIRVLYAVQPTRGLDVGSIEYIHRRLVEKRNEGAAVLLVSTELDEILSLSDRVAVMYEGQIMAILPVEEATAERLGLLMAGIRESTSPKTPTAND